MNKLNLAIILSLSLTACDASQGWSDVSDVPPTPDAGPVDAAPKKYATFCDFAVPLITAYCEKQVACGYLDNDDRSREQCFGTFFTYAQLRCAVPLELPDAHYDACLAGFETLQCVAGGALPDNCGFFE